MGGGKEKSVGKCGEGCGRVYWYGVSGKVCWLVGRGMGKL